MDRDEAIALLRGGKDGVREWNRRRKADEPIPDLTGAELPGAQLVGAMLGGVQLSNADLSGAQLSNVDLTGADLIFANLRGADLHDAKLPHAHLTGADVRGANLSGMDADMSHLIKACLEGSRCSQACFHKADLSHANLADADLTGADLSGARLVDANLTGAVLKSTNLEGTAVMGVSYKRRRLICRGIRADSCFGHAVLKRDLQDQDWIETFRAQSRHHYVLYVLWWLASDCGRSLWRVAAAALTLAVCFGVVYDAVPVLLNTQGSVDSSFTPYYYSIVTFTTLGFGDVKPGSVAGEVVVTLEVMLGYVTLGVLVSILANKVARRS